MDAAESATSTDASAAQPAHRDVLLAEHLRSLFPDAPAEALDFMKQHLQWVEVAAGETLIVQGDAGDAAYLALSGRLRVYVTTDDGERAVRELARGAVIGEMSLFTGEPRSATVVAVRDSVLVKLDKPHFEALLLKHPQVSLTFTRQMIGRLQTEHQRVPLDAPVTIGVFGISEGIDTVAFAADLAAQLARHGRVCVADAATIERLLGETGAAARADAAVDHRIAMALDRLEATHDFMLLVGSAQPDAWTQRCVRNSDEMLLVADAAQAPALHAVEQACLVGRPARSEAAEILVLCHPAEQRFPRGTRHWLARRPVTAHVHLRRGRSDESGDMGRLARLLSRNAVALVLAGGGARGFAHLGVWRALRERGIEVDVVAGTSIGAIMAALIAADPPVDTAVDIARRAFGTNPTGDYSLLPLVSLIKGGRVRTAVRSSLEELTGGQVDIEDLWKPFFCIASNYSQAREQRLERGDLGRALLASTAIPGALPPVVHDGDLLCDGGTFNNFPVDAMRGSRGVGRVIGVDLGVRNPRRLDFDELPGAWTLLFDRLRPRKRRRYRLPSLTAYLLNVTILYSSSRQRAVQRLTDLYLNPPLYKVGLLQWSRFDQIVRQGHEYAAEVLDKLPDSERARLAGQDRSPLSRG